MKNAIPNRIFDFLRHYPPFSLLKKEELLQLAQKVVVQYFQAEEVIFKQGEQPKDYIYVVKEGAIHLIRTEENQKTLFDVCDEGDVFGIRPLLADQAYSLTALVEEESLIYAVNVSEFRHFVANNSKIAWYLAQNFATGVRNINSSDHKGRLFLHNDHLIDGRFQLVEIQSIEHSKSPVSCLPPTSIQEAARIMRDKNVGSIVITNSKEHPIGIITDRDLRNKVVTGDVPLSTAIRTIMSSPVNTIAPQLTVADVQIAMMKNRVHHLVITENGQADSKIIGVISEHDLLVVQGNNPAIFIREIRRSKDGTSLRLIREKAEYLLEKYLHQEVAIDFIATIMSEINDALIHKAIQLAQQNLEAKGIYSPNVKWCWLALGSEGREEQLLRTDQDNALVFANVEEAAYKTTKDYFLSLSKKVTDILNECGFEYCPADMMASNPRWCLSLAEWQQQFSKWIFEPTLKNIMYCTIFFDYRPIYGDKTLADDLTQHIFNIIDKKEIFLSYLAKNALQNPPPLTFFRNFVVENDGKHKDEFDIKARAMMPLADAARVLTLQHKISRVNNTFKRFEHLAEVEPNHKELFQQAADAYEILVRYRAIHGLKNKDSGRFFNPSNLSKMQRLLLRNSFQPISALQSILKTRFQLNWFG